jgi:hypothetical protein
MIDITIAAIINIMPTTITIAGSESGGIFIL